MPRVLIVDKSKLELAETLSDWLEVRDTMA